MDAAIAVAIVDAVAAVTVVAIAADAATFVVAAALKHCHRHFQVVGFAHFDFHWIILSINILVIKHPISIKALKFTYH